VFVNEFGTRETRIELRFSVNAAPIDENTAMPSEKIAVLSETKPIITPPIAGDWEWWDATRLVLSFKSPEWEIEPGRRYEFDFSKLVVRPGVKAPQGILRLDLPELKAVLNSCWWDDSREAPPQRTPHGIVKFNYPVYEARGGFRQPST